MEVSIGRIPCIIVDDHVAIKVEIDGAADIDQYHSMLLRPGSLTRKFSWTIVDGYRSYGDWMHMICRGSKRCNIVELLKYLLID